MVDISPGSRGAGAMKTIAIAVAVVIIAIAACGVVGSTYYALAELAHALRGMPAAF